MHYFPPSNQFEGSIFFQIFFVHLFITLCLIFKKHIHIFVYYDLGAFTTFSQVQTKFPFLIPILQRYGPY